MIYIIRCIRFNKKNKTKSLVYKSIIEVLALKQFFLEWIIH